MTFLPLHGLILCIALSVQLRSGLLSQAEITSHATYVLQDVTWAEPSEALPQSIKDVAC